MPLRQAFLLWLIVTSNLALVQESSAAAGRTEQAVLRFEVYEHDGRPATGIRLKMRLADAARRFSTRLDKKPIREFATGPDGKILVNGLKVGKLVYQVQFEDNAPAYRLGSVWLRPGVNRLPLIRKQGGRLVGRVVDRGGQPIPFVRVFLVRARGEKPTLANIEVLFPEPQELASWALIALTKLDGSFEIRGATGGAYQVLATHPEYALDEGTSLRIWEGTTVRLDKPIRMQPSEEVYGQLRVEVPGAEGRAYVRFVRYPESGIERAAICSRIMRRYSSIRRGLWRTELPVDADGFMTLKDLVPGRYYVSVKQVNKAQVCYTDLEVTAGKTATVKGVRPTRGGMIEGRVRGCVYGNQGTTIFIAREDDPEFLAAPSDIKRLATWVRSHVPYEQGSIDLIAPGSNYSIAFVAPGRYTLVAVTEEDHVGLIHGLEVTEGKTTTAPEIDFGTGPAKGRVFVGRALLPDGSPAEGATITLRAYCHGWVPKAKTGRGGRFRITPDDCRVPRPPWFPFTRLRAEMPGYHSQEIDLAVPGLDLQQLSVRFTKDERGHVRVTVTSATGRPLSGASVRRLGGYGNTTQQTDGKGQTLFRDLESGPYAFEVRKHGFFLAEPVRIQVVAGDESELLVRMKTGLSLKGRVELPDGCDPAKTFVYTWGLSDRERASLVSGVDAEGRFQFKGLMPTKVHLFAVAPGMGSTSSECEVTPNAPAVRLRLQPFSGVKMALKPPEAGGRLSLSPCGKWDPREESGSVYPWSRVARIDSKGLAVFQQVPAGTYDLLIPSPSGRLPPMGTARTSLVHRNVKVDPLEGGLPSLLQTASLTIPAQVETGSVKGRLDYSEALKQEMDIPLQVPYDMGYREFYVIGTDAMSFVERPLRALVAWQETPIQIGKPPEGFYIEDPTRFAVVGLPPGKYDVLSRCALDNPNSFDGLGPRYNYTPFVRLNRISVEAGRTVDLGTIPCRLTPAIRECLEEHARREVERSCPAP